MSRLSEAKHPKPRTPQQAQHETKRNKTKQKEKKKNPPPPDFNLEPRGNCKTYRQVGSLRRIYGAGVALQRLHGRGGGCSAAPSTMTVCYTFG